MQGLCNVLYTIYSTKLDYYQTCISTFQWESTVNTLQLVLQPYQDKSNGQPQSIASYCSNAGPEKNKGVFLEIM